MRKNARLNGIRNSRFEVGDAAELLDELGKREKDRRDRSEPSAKGL
jgi:tRNA/tmRNA/rRNA uracil-C5-methylase (TrmA/RlmC/RlmD family)